VKQDFEPSHGKIGRNDCGSFESTGDALSSPPMIDGCLMASKEVLSTRAHMLAFASPNAWKEGSKHPGNETAIRSAAGIREAAPRQELP
jgi:hypothetical protein